MTVYDKSNVQDKAITIRLEGRLFDGVKDLADENERTVSAEIRLILRNHLQSLGRAS